MAETNTIHILTELYFSMKRKLRLLLYFGLVVLFLPAINNQVQAQCGLLPAVLSTGSLVTPNGLCTPVTVNMRYDITFAAPLPAGPNYVLSFFWGDGAASFTQVVLAPGSAVYSVTRPHVYPVNSDCEYQVQMFISVNSAGACGTTRQTQLVTTWRTDAFNGGNVQLISPATGNNIHTVCEGVNISVIFDDQSVFNCNAVYPANYPPNAPINNPNLQVRWQQIVYNTPNGAPRIPNVSVNGVLMPAAAGSNYQDPRGVSFYNPPPVILNDPRRRDALVITAPGGFTAGFPVVGQEFEVTVRYWNFCNPYANDFDLTPVGGDLINGDNPPVEQTAIIRIIDSPNPPVVPNRDICSGDSRTLTVTAPVGGQTYRWWTDAAATVSAGPNGTTFTPTSAQAPAGQRTHFWVTTEVAPALGSCRSAPTEVTLLRRTLLTSPTPISGPTNLCPNTSYTFSVPTGAPPNPPDITITDPLSGNVNLATDFVWTVPAGWTINSGQNTNSINVTTGAAAAGTISVVQQYETAPTCPSAPATTLAVTVRARPTVNITPDPVNICEGTTVQLNGNPSTVFGAISSHTWGGSTAILDATNVQQPNILAAAAPGAYGLTYFATADFGGGVFCSSTTDASTVNISASPTPAAAGPDQNLCIPAPLDATLAGSNPGVGTGTWTRISGPGAAPTFTPNANTPGAVARVFANGVHVFRWTVVNGTCTSFDEVSIDYGTTPPVSAAGGDQDVCSLSATLNGNDPTFATGTWVQTAGPGTSSFVPNANTRNAVVTVTAFGTYTYRWRLASGTCPPSDDFVDIIFREAPTAAGPADFTFCVDNPPTVTIPLSGTFGGGATQARWERISGTGTFTSNGTAIGNFDNSNPATDVYTPTAADFAAGSIQVRLATDDPVGACVAVNDPVTITIDRLPANAAAGGDFATCDPTANLAATAANNGGTGTWSIGSALYYETFTNPNGTGLSGPNPHALTFTHPTNNWTITAPGVNTLLAADDYLRVQGGVMEAQDVNAELVWRSPSINILGQPNVTVSIQLADFGPKDPTDYIQAFYRLNGVGAEIPIGSIIDDSGVDGTFTTFTQVIGGGNTTIEIIVRVLSNTNGEIYRFDNVFVSGTGSTLPFITDVNNPTTSITGLPVGSTTFIWTVTSALGVCSSTVDQVVVTRHASPVNNNQTPSLCEDSPGSADATVTLAFLTTLTNAITGGAPSTTVQFFSDAGRTVPYPVSDVLATSDIVYTRVTRTDVLPNCTTDGTVTFTVNSRPAALDQNPEFCEDAVGSNTLTGINLTLLNNAVKNNVVANTVAWFSDALLTIPVPDPTNVTANDGTSFFARVTDINGCTDDAEVEITLNPVPPPNALIGPTDVCLDPSAVTLYQLTVNNIGYTYAWTIPDPPFDQVLGGGVNDFLVLLSFPVLGADVLSVVETSDKGCVGQPNTINISIDTSPPAITILDASLSPGPGAVCANEAGVVYTVANLANTTYSWTVPAGSSIIAGQGTNQITVNFGALAGLISVIPTTSAGCAGNPDDYAVAINPNPSLDLLANSVCSDDQAGITLSGPGAATFNITNVTVPPGLSPVARATGNGFFSNEIFGDVFTNTTGGNLIVQYSVVPVSAFGCEGTAGQVNLTVRPEPTLAPNLNDVICSTVDAVGVQLEVAVGSVAADQFQITSINNPSGLTAVAGAPAVGGPFNSVVLMDDRWENLGVAPATIEYFVRPINSITSCVGDPPLPVTITVNPEPQVTSPVAETICSGSSPTLTLTSSLGPTSSFTWTVKSITGFISGTSSGTGSSITNVLVNNDLVPGTVTYEVTATGPVGLGSCTGQPVDVVITIDPSPIANLITQIVCSDAAGGNTFTQDLQALENSVNNTGTVTFAWFQDAALTIPIVAPALNAYVLTNNVPVFVEVDNGQCQKAVPVTFTVNPTPSINTSVTSSYNGFQISCTGASDGQITAVPADGTGPYQFSIDGGGSFFNSAAFNGLSVAGNPYVIRVRDINGCTEDSAPLSLVPPPALTAVGAITSNYNGEDVSCQAASDGIVTITPGGGTGTYTFQLLELPSNTTGDASGIYTGLRAGTYTFIVKDANNCQFTLPVITITEPTPVTASAVLTSPVSCNGNTDGVITVTGAGGTLIGPNYQFTLNQAPFTVNATGVFNGLAAGNYTVDVEDDNGCVKTSNTVSVTQPSALTAFASVTSNYNGAKISCFGANDAQVTGIANGGNGGYSYVLDQDLLNLTGTVDGSFENLGPGNYSITVTDAGGCSVTSLLVNVTEPAQIAAAALVTGTISCNAGSDGQITVSASGGTGAYSFEQIVPAGPTNVSGIFNALAQGTYDFEVTDLNGCSDIVQLTINEPTVVTAAAAVTSNYNGAQISCNGANNGIITVTGAGGTGSLQYVFDQFVLTNTTGQFTGVFTGVPAGVGYTFTVRDSKNCTVVTAPIDVTQPVVVTASGVVTSNYNGEDISCFGASDGIITVTANGGTGAYTYSLDQVPSNATGNATGIYTGVGAGIYTVTVRDVNNCTIVTLPITVTAPPTLTATAVVTSNYNGRQISCNGASDGIITVTPGGGVPGYTFVLNEIPLNVSGAATGIFTGVPAGTYTITVTDLNTCQRVTTAVTVSEPAVLTATAAVTSNFNGQQISCNGASDGTIKVTPTGGTVPYSYVLVEIPGNVTGAATGTFTGVPAGTYTFNVLDVNNCPVTTAPVTITPPTPVVAAAAVTSNYNGSQVSCNGASDGVITVTASGGTGILQYTFDQFALSNTTGQFSGVFTGVPAGVGYTFTVRDANNCTVATIAIDVTEPVVVTASGVVSSNFNGEDISCVGASDGEITVTANGGTGAYTYRIDQAPLNVSGNATGIYTGLSAGIYTATVRDVNNCFIVTAPITITSPPALTATAAVTSNYNGRQISCNGASDGIITVTPGGGVPGYTFVLNEIPLNVSGAATGIFTGVPAGTYTITVTDLNTCQRITTAVTVSEPAVLTATASVTSNFNGQQISCNGASDGTIKVTPTGGTVPYSYVLVEIPGNVTGAATGTFTGVPAGTYTFNVLDVNNCPVTTAPVTITPPTPVVAVAAVTSNYNGSQVSCFGLSDGVITVTASGGTGTLQYTFDQIPANTSGQFSGIFSGVPAGVGYTFTVRDVNNCSIVTVPINVTQPVAINASGVVSSNYNGEDITCVGAADGAILITANDGTGAYTYKLDQAPSNTTGDATGNYTGLSAGSYTVTVRDANNCFVVTAPIIITSPPVLTATAAVTSNYNGRQISCNGASDGIITVTPGGGVPGYTFVLVEMPANVSGAATGIFTGVPAGTYTIEVRDLNLCQRITTAVTVSEPAVLTATSAVTSNYNGEQISCNGASDGIIRVTTSGGTTPYSFVLVEIPGNVTGAATGIFTGIPTGTYTFNVLDVNNCPVTTLPVTVSEPTPVVASAAVTSNYNGSQISCNGISDGVITVTSSGGTGDAIYVFDQFPIANQSGRFSGIFTSVPAGVGYTFTVTDANGCPVVTAPIDVTEPLALNVSGIATSNFNGFNVRCFTETNGQITVTASGGNGALTYMLLEDAGNVSGIATGIFDNLRAGSFRARVTDTNGCLFTTAPIIVTQPNNLALTISKTSNYNGFDVSCIGAADGEITVNTTTGGAGGYVFALDGFPGNVTGQASGIFTGVAAGLYTITVTDVNTCTRQSLPVILSDPLPLFEGIIGLDKSICLGADPTAFTELAAAFGGIGNYAYQWRESTDGVLFSDVLGATSATFDPPAVAVTTFYKRLITSGTCVTLESNTVTVTVNPLPTATLVPSKSPVCEGDFFLLEFTFTGQAPFFFDYNDGTTFVNDRLGAAVTPVPVLNYTNTTTYTITEVRDFNGCVAPVLPAPVTVPVIKINPNFVITSPSAQCSGGQFDFEFTVDPDVEYTWIWGDGQVEVIPANSLPNGTNPISHTYISFNTSGTTNFPVILQAINNVQGCGPAQTNKTIQIFPNILINLFPNKTEICGGDQVVFTNPTAGGTTHHWFYREQGVVEMQDERTFVAASTQTFTFNNTTTQNPIIYELVYEVSNANCAADTVIEITVYREVAAAFSKTTPVPLFIGGNANMTFTNTSVPIDGAEFRYDWDFGTASSLPPTTGVGPFNLNYIAPGTKTVNLLATNLIALANGLTCTSQYQETFDILLPPLQAGFEYTPQFTCFPSNITITRNLATGDTYTWRLVDGTGRQLLVSNDTLPTFNISSPGRYVIFLTTTNTLTGQSASADNNNTGTNIIAGNPADPTDFSAPIDIYPPPFAGFEARPTVVFVPDTELQTFNFSSSSVNPITATTYPIYYKWYFGDGTDTLTSTVDPIPSDVNSNFEPRHLYVNEGSYDIALLAINDHGNGAVCIDTAIQRIQAKAAGFTRVPNAFTPSPNGPTGGVPGNGSSPNDVFLPIAKGIVDFQMQIFDRWGNLVFESKDKTIGWDGYDRDGNLLPAGVYVYKLVLRLSNDQRTTQIGDVTLIR